MAVSHNRIYVRHYDLLDSPRNFIGVAYMAKWFHPELFRDLNPKAIHQEYLDRFLRLDFDLSKTEVFAYLD